MSLGRRLLIEGYSPDELLALPDQAIEQLAIGAGPFVVRAGSASILGEIRIVGECITVELAHIDGGGKRVLPGISSFIHRYARLRRMERVEWIVHAATCARPNLELRRVLIRRGFQLVDRGGSPVYRLLEEVAAGSARHRHQ